VGRLDLLRSGAGEVLVPRAVVEELSLAEGHPKKVICDAILGALDSPPFRRLPSNSSEPPEARGSLGKGERAAIAEALVAPNRVLLTDDGAARLLAIRLGVEVHGTLGVVVISNHAGILSKSRAELVISQLLHEGLRASSDVVVRCLEFLQ